jgi:TolB-like protein
VTRFNPVAFYRELRRRRVVQVALIYAAVAGGVISACDWIFPQVPVLAAIPEQALHWVIIAAVACFPVALIGGWLYDITGDGIRRTPSFSATAHDPDTTLHRVDRWIIGGLSAVTVGVIALAVVKIVQIEPPVAQATVASATPTALDPMALAVLPLVDRSANGEDADLLAFGLHDTLLSRLSKIRALRVISRTTMDQYKGTDKKLPEIARELGVANLIEGSVQRTGNKVRISVQLIRAPNDEHLWAEVYDEELTASNLFEIQSEVARAVAAQLAATLSPEDQRALADVPTDNTAAYTAYMLGRRRLADRQVAQLADAIEQFSRAIELDPGYAAAYSGLVDACNIYRAYSGRWHSGSEFHPQCPKDPEQELALARRAVELDDQCGEAWISLASVLRKRLIEGARKDDRLRDEIEQAFQRGLALSPSHTQGYHWYAIFLANQLGQREQAMQVLRDGLEVDPLAILLHFVLSEYADSAGDLDTAREHAERIVEIAPDSPRGYERLADIQAGVDGRFDLAIRGYLRAARLDPKGAGYYGNAGYGYGVLQDYDTALAYLDESAAVVGIGEQPWERALPLLHMGRAAEARQRLQQSFDRLQTGVQGLQEPRSRSDFSYPAWVLTGFDLSAAHPDVALARYKRYWPQCFEVEHLQDCPSLCVLGTARVWQSLGEAEQAERLLEYEWSLFQSEIRQRGQHWRFGWGAGGIADVSLLAMLGRKEEALDALEDAVRQGYRGWGTYQLDWQHLARFDAALDSIRSDPRFKAAFAVIEADMAKQLASVREMERRGEIPTLDELRKLRASTPDRGATQEPD